MIPITKETKKEQEEKELDLLKNTYNVDLVILARYMQIISDTFCNTFPFQVINIHHSFLPAFIGGKPYHRAHARGVKVIGATVCTESIDNLIHQYNSFCSAQDCAFSICFSRRITRQPNLTKDPLLNRYEYHLSRQELSFIGS